MTTEPTPPQAREIVVVFDGPPSAVPGRFVEVEDAKTREGVGIGEWKEDPDHSGWWLLALTVLDV